MQVLLEKSDRDEITGKTRQRIWEELLPQYQQSEVTIRRLLWQNFRASPVGAIWSICNRLFIPIAAP